MNTPSKTSSCIQKIRSNMMTRRSVLGMTAAFGTLSVLSACNSSQDSATNVKKPDNKDPFKIKFVLDYTPNTNHTGIYVALKKGFYKDEGLDLDIIQPPQDGADALIGAGSAQLGVSYQDFIAQSLASEHPLPYRAVAALIQHNSSGIMSRKADNITSPKAMENHRYTTWNLPIEQATVKEVVEDDGGDFSKVELVPYEVDDEVSGLKANMFDTVWVFEGWAVQNAHVQNYDVNYFPFISINSVFDIYTPVLAANDDFIKDHPDELRAFLRATEKGYRFAIENPDAAADILLEAVPELSEALIKESQNFLAKKYVDDAKRWGDIDPERWSRFYAWLNEHKLVEREIDIKAGFTTDYLPEK